MIKQIMKIQIADTQLYINIPDKIRDVWELKKGMNLQLILDNQILTIIKIVNKREKKPTKQSQLKKSIKKRRKARK